MNSLSDRSLRLAYRLAASERFSAHFDPVTQKSYRFHERNETLLKYRERNDVFGSFTDVLPQGRENKGQGAYGFSPKLGVNPSSTYNTPIGIYCYPVDYIIRKYNSSNQTFKVPFAGDMSYLHVFRVNNPTTNTLVFDGDQTQILDQYHALTFSVNDVMEGGFREIVPYLEEAGEVLAGERENLRAVPMKYRKRWAFMSPKEKKSFREWYSKIWYPRFLRKTGLGQLNDPGLVNVIIYKGMLRVEDFSRVWNLGFYLFGVKNGVFSFLKDRTLATKSPPFPFEEQIKKLPQAKSLTESEYLRLRQEVLAERVDCDNGFAWNMTRHLSNKNPRVWTGLLRSLGFIGAIDHGTATIHTSEPTQAVFFDISTIKVLEVIHNEQPHQTDNERKRAEWSRNVDKGIQEALDIVEAFIRDVRGGDTYFSDNPLLLRSISWLDRFASDTGYWSRKIRENFATELETAAHGTINVNKRYHLEKIAKILRRLPLREKVT